MSNMCCNDTDDYNTDSHAHTSLYIQPPLELTDVRITFDTTAFFGDSVIRHGCYVVTRICKLVSFVSDGNTHSFVHHVFVIDNASN